MDAKLQVSFECRDIRHSWQRSGDIVLLKDRSTNKVREFARTLACARCGTERIDEYRMTVNSLVRERTRYRYVTDYQHRGGRYPLEQARIERFTEDLGKILNGDPGKEEVAR